MLALALAAALGGFLFLRGRQASNPGPQAPTEEIRISDIASHVDAAGTLRPRLNVDVGAQVSGQVRQLHVALGDTVRAGQLLVSLDPDMATADLRNAEARLTQQDAELQAKDIAIAAANRALIRQRSMHAAHATSEADLDTAQSAVARLRAERLGLQANRLQLQAELEKRRLALAYTSIQAPIDGEVTRIAVEKGQTVLATQATPVMLTLAQLDMLTVRTRVSEADIQDVHTGQTASFTSLAPGSPRHTGRIRLIEPTPERVNDALFYNVLFDVPNPGHTLLSDMTVQVRIATASAHGVLCAPLAALGARDDAGRYRVRVLGPQGAIRPRWIRVGLHDAAKVQVLDGLVAGEHVLLAPDPDPPPKG